MGAKRETKPTGGNEAGDWAHDPTRWYECAWGICGHVEDARRTRELRRSVG